MKILLKVIALLGVVGLFGLVGVRVLEARRSREANSAQISVQATAVHVAPATRRDVAERIELTGVIRPRNEVDIFTKMPGRVEHLLVKVGDKVSAGQVLAVIEHREIGWQTAQAGSQAEAASAALAQARAQADAAKANYDRAKLLRDSNAIPAAEFERVDTAYRASLAGLRAAEAQLRMAGAARGLAGEALKNSKVVSPIDGTVTRKNVNLGTHASPAMPMFQVQDIAVLRLDGSITAAEYQRLKHGQQAVVRVDELPNDEFVGTLASISPSLDPQTRRAAVEISIENTRGALLPNMFANAAVDVGVNKGVIAVPTSAIVALPSGKIIYLEKEGKAVARKVSIGTVDGEWSVVHRGLNDGELVITEGQGSLVDGSPVVVVPAESRAEREPR